MLPFLLSSLAAAGCFFTSIKEYQKLKRYLLEGEEELEEGQAEPSLTFVDLLFHDRIKEDSEARRIQKRAIGFFCGSLLMVHVAMLFYGGCLH